MIRIESLSKTMLITVLFVLGLLVVFPAGWPAFVLAAIACLAVAVVTEARAESEESKVLIRQSGQFAYGTRPPPPPLPGTGAQACPGCGQPLTFIPQYEQWYCYAEKRYPWRRTRA